MTPEELDEMELLWKRRMPTKDIAERLGYSEENIKATVGRMRDRFPYRHTFVPRGKKELWVARIRAGRATVSDAAQALDVHPYTVKKWLDRFS